MNGRLIHVGIPTLHCYNRLTRLLQALDDSSCSDFALDFTIVDNGGKLSESPWMEQLSALKSEVRIVTPTRNLGVSASWNAILRFLGQCIIANDDIMVSKEDIGTLVQKADECPESMFVAGQEGGWTIFWANRPGKWLSMSGFDENFYPAYYEDNDADRRLMLEGLHRTQVILPSWVHDNSSTLYDGSIEYQKAHWVSFNKNGLYYQRKWGGMPGSEQFTTPFNTNT